MSNVSTFVFNQSDVRVLNINGEPWFVAKDLCDVLELSEVSNSLKRLDSDEKLTRTLFVSGQNRDVSVVSESGMYSLVLTSRKAQAKVFKKWITSEVLPTIRKTGKYETQPSLPEVVQPKVISPGTVQDHVEGLKALFELMNVTSDYIPGLVAEGIKEAHPQLAGTVETGKILMASNSENDIKEQSFTVTDIGEMLEPVVKARDVNTILRAMGLQYKLHKNWVLTEEGKEAGGVVIATTSKGSKHTREQVRWKSEVVDLIKEFLG